MAAEVSLREVLDQDLRELFAHQADPVGADMAGVESRDWPAFDAHWAKVRKDPSVLARTIVYDGQVAGNAVVFDMAGRREVGYFIGRPYWGKGIASAALAQLLALEPHRPLHAQLLPTNVASRRVLERNGFTYLERDGEDLVLILRG